MSKIIGGPVTEAERSTTRAVDLWKGMDCGRFDPEKSDHIHGRAGSPALFFGDMRGVKVHGCEACVFGRGEHTCGLRCPVCDWPMASRLEEGCIPGNCSYRPSEGTPEYYRIQARRNALMEASC